MAASGPRGILGSRIAHRVAWSPWSATGVLGKASDYRWEGAVVGGAGLAIATGLAAHSLCRNSEFASVRENCFGRTVAGVLVGGVVGAGVGALIGGLIPKGPCCREEEHP